MHSSHTSGHPKCAFLPNYQSSDSDPDATDLDYLLKRNEELARQKSPGSLDQAEVDQATVTESGPPTHLPDERTLDHLWKRNEEPTEGGRAALIKRRPLKALHSLLYQAKREQKHLAHQQR